MNFVFEFEFLVFLMLRVLRDLIKYFPILV